MIYVMSGGGKSLPFRVLVSTSQPSSPKKFDIWVKTAVAATQIRFINNGMPAPTTNLGGVMIKYDGNVWWNTDNFTLIAGVKSNGVPVYAHAKLLGCYQAKTISASTGKAPYELVEAYYYGGSSWVQFSSERQYLIESGTERQTFTADSASVGKANGYLYVTKMAGYDPGSSSYYTTVDLTGFDTLYIDGFNRGNDYDVHAYVKVQSADGATTNAQVQLQTIRTTATINVSAITGNCRVLLESQAHLFNPDTSEYRVAEPAIYNLYLT